MKDLAVAFFALAVAIAVYAQNAGDGSNARPATPVGGMPPALPQAIPETNSDSPQNSVPVSLPTNQASPSTAYAGTNGLGFTNGITMPTNATLTSLSNRWQGAANPPPRHHWWQLWR